MKPALVIAGHAHLQSYLPAGTLPSAEATPLRVGALTVMNGPLPRDPRYWAAFAQAAQGGAAAIVWGGDQHDRFLIEPTPPLDFVLSTAPDLPLDPRASYVAEAQLRAVFAPSFAGLAELITTLREGGATVLVAGTSPPLEDTEALATRLATDERFAADHGATALGQATPAGPVLTSPYTIQKLWSLVQTMTAEIATQSGAAFVAVPDRLRSPDGFLLPDYWGAGLLPNAQFGQDMAAELSAAAGMTDPQ